MTKGALTIRGRVSSEFTARWENFRHEKIGNNSAVFFCDYSDFDIPLNTKFNSLQMGDVSIYSGTMKLKAVTQEFFKSFDSVPQGWKTICEIEFSTPPYQLISRIPIIKDWYDENSIQFTLIYL
jgi:hypothetical protein